MDKETRIRMNIGRDGYDQKRSPGGRFLGSVSAIATAQVESPGAGGPRGLLFPPQNTIREGPGFLSSNIAQELGLSAP